MNLYNILVFVGLLLTVGYSNAQSGPELPCPGCQQEYVKPTPYEGSWFNPEQSGSGFLIEVENDKLLGYYFGYDEAGEPIWALFDGQLQDAADEGGLWKVNSTLGKYKGGNCINCDYKPPSEIEEIGDIEIIFNRHAHASFSINGGDVQNIVPLYFGFETSNHFEEQTSFPIPELEGWWTVFVKENNGTLEIYNTINYMIHLSRAIIAGDGTLNFSATYYPNPPEALSFGYLRCEYDQNSSIEGVECYFPLGLYHYFDLNLPSISSDRIYGESPTGDTLEMIRLSYNLCISPSSPEYCVNTGSFDYLND